MLLAMLQSVKSFSVGNTIVMAHAVFRFNGDIVSTFDNFPPRQIHGISLHNLLGQVLSRVSLCRTIDRCKISAAQDLDVDCAYSTGENRHRR